MSDQGTPAAESSYEGSGIVPPRHLPFLPTIIPVSKDFTAGTRCARNRRLGHPLYTRTGQHIRFAGQGAGRGNSLPELRLDLTDPPGLVLKAESKKGRPQGCLVGSFQGGEMPRGNAKYPTSG